MKHNITGSVFKLSKGGFASWFAGFIGLIACFFFCRLVFAGVVEWQLAKDEKGIKVFTREVEGAEVKEFRGVTSVQASMESIVALFEDTARGCEWFYQCKEFTQIQEKSRTEKFFYFRQGLPWPVSDRDVVTRRLREEDAVTEVVSYTISEFSGLYPEQKKVVRMPYLRVSWRFIPKENGAVEIDYQTHADPGGTIPKWLINRLSVDIPYHTLRRFKEMLQEPRNQTARPE